MKRRFVFLTALLGLLLSGGGAHADYTYVFTDSTGASTGNAFSVAQGSTVDVRVYLAETGTSTGLQNPGLNSGGVQLNTSSPSIANVTAVTANATFNNSSSGTGANAFVTVNQTFGAPVTAPVSGPDANRILLGTFTFTGVNAGSTLTVTAVPSTGTNVNVLAGPDNNGVTVLDGMLNAANVTASITVTAVPEPGSFLLAGLAAAGLGFGAWRRRRNRGWTPTAASLA